VTASSHQELEAHIEPWGPIEAWRHRLSAGAWKLSWSPGGSDLWLRLSPGGSDWALEAQMEPWRLRLSPGSSHWALEALKTRVLPYMASKSRCFARGFDENSTFRTRFWRSVCQKARVFSIMASISRCFARGFDENSTFRTCFGHLLVGKARVLRAKTRRSSMLEQPWST